MSAPPRLKSAFLWGTVGFLSFLVLLQGYALLQRPLISVTQGFLLAVVVGVGTAGAAYVFEYRVAAWAARRRES